MNIEEIDKLLAHADAPSLADDTIDAMFAALRSARDALVQQQADAVDAKRYRELCRQVSLGRRGRKRRHWEVRQDNGGFTMRNLTADVMTYLLDDSLAKEQSNG